MTRQVWFSAAALLLLCPVMSEAQQRAQAVHAQPQAVPAPDRGPSLQETLGFIRDVLASYGTVQTIWTSPNGQMQRVANIATTSLDSTDGCKLTFTQSFTIPGAQNASPGKLYVDLADLDPSASKVDAMPPYSDSNGSLTYPFFFVDLSGRNLAKVVTWHVPGFPPAMQSNARLEVTTQELAARLANAAVHAIELCGGKKSAF